MHPKMRAKIDAFLQKNSAAHKTPPAQSDDEPDPFAERRAKAAEKAAMKAIEDSEAQKYADDFTREYRRHKEQAALDAQAAAAREVELAKPAFHEVPAYEGSVYKFAQVGMPTIGPEFTQFPPASHGIGMDEGINYMPDLPRINVAGTRQTGGGTNIVMACMLLGVVTLNSVFA